MKDKRQWTNLFLISPAIVKNACSTLIESLALVSRKGIPSSSAKACSVFVIVNENVSKPSRSCVRRNGYWILSNLKSLRQHSLVNDYIHPCLKLWPNSLNDMIQWKFERVQWKAHLERSARMRAYLSSFGGNNFTINHVIFVTDKKLANTFISISIDLTQPLLHVVEAFHLSTVIHNLLQIPSCLSLISWMVN